MRLFQYLSLYWHILSSLLYYTVTRLIGKIIDFTKTAPEYFNTLSGMWIDVQAKLFQYTSGMPVEVVNAIQTESKVIFDSMRISILHLLSYERIVALATEIPNLLVSLIVFIIALFLFMLELPAIKAHAVQTSHRITAEKVTIYDYETKRSSNRFHESTTTCKFYYICRYIRWTTYSLHLNMQ